MCAGEEVLGKERIHGQPSRWCRKNPNIWGTDKHKGVTLRTEIEWQQGREEKKKNKQQNGPGRSIDVETKEYNQVCVTSYSPSKLLVGHLLADTAKMPCVFQDPWVLVFPICQAKGGTMDASPGSPLRHV